MVSILVACHYAVYDHEEEDFKPKSEPTQTKPIHPPSNKNLFIDLHINILLNTSYIYA